MDTIFLEGVELSFHVGITREEKAFAQPCSLDLEIAIDLKEAGRTGDLSRTLDYAVLFAELEKLSVSRPFVLLEEIALLAADLVLQHPLVRQVRVRIKKLQPFTPKVKSVGVEIRKSRKSDTSIQDYEQGARHFPQI